MTSWKPPRRLLVLTATALTLAVVAPVAVAATQWVRWQGRYFIAWIPNRQWQVVESARSITVSSPTGLATVEFVTADKAPGPSTTTFLRTQSFADGSYSRVRFLSQSRITPIAGGGESQTFHFTARRTRDGASVRGILKADVFNNYLTGAYGYTGYMRVAPQRDWTKWAPTLTAVQNRLLYIGHG